MKGKIAYIMSVLLTHPSERYVEIFKVSPDIVVVERTSTFQIYAISKLLKKSKIKFMFNLNDALFLPIGKIFGINIRPRSFLLEKIISNADFITVNGHYLMNYVGRFNANVDIIYEICNRYKIKIEQFNQLSGVINCV